MVHQRIRPFNTRVTYPEQALDNDLAQAVVAGNIVFLRGQVGQDLDTVPYGITSPAQNFQFTFACVPSPFVSRHMISQRFVT